MKKRKTIGYISLAFLVITLAGCGYTKEEKADMKRYEAQGRENAKDYIKEKYGVDVKIRKVTCEKYNSGPVPDFSPTLSKLIIVTVQYLHSHKSIVNYSASSAGACSAFMLKLIFLSASLKSTILASIS